MEGDSIKDGGFSEGHFVVVKSTRNITGPDPRYNAVFKYYLPETGDSTLQQLIELAVDEQS